MTINKIPQSQYRQIFLTDKPLLDVRAPIEFDKGAFPSATNLPLMNDNERQQIGICYKEQGQEAALTLGHSLVDGNIKRTRIDAWIAYAKLNPSAYLYCFRGGLRSRLTQQALQQAGFDMPYIDGGYKAMRQYLLNVFTEIDLSRMPLFIISGITGSGKTDLLQQHSESIDLEGIANHRGSSFGRYHQQQPSQINFENQLAIALLKHQHANHNYLLLEDESFLIGKRAIPQVMYLQMQQAPMLVIEEPQQARLQRLQDSYVDYMYQGFVDYLGEQAGFEAFSQYLHQGITAIKKRLGGKDHDELQALITQALTIQKRTGDRSSHLAWGERLLQQYYDPMYRYQLEQKRQRICFKGTHEEIHQWLAHYTKQPQTCTL